MGLDDSGYLGAQDGQGTNFCNDEELLAGAASLLITSDLVPDIDHIDHSLPDVPTSVPELHVPLSLDQMLSDSDELSETEDVLKTIDLNDVLKQRSTSDEYVSSEERGEKPKKSAFEGLFDDFKNYCDNAEKSIDIKEELHSINVDSSEETDYGLEQFDFDLCNIEKTDLPSEEEVTSHIIDDFLTSMFGEDASEDANDYNDLLNSILTEENI